MRNLGDDQKVSYTYRVTYQMGEMKLSNKNISKWFKQTEIFFLLKSKKKSFQAFQCRSFSAKKL